MARVKLTGYFQTRSYKKDGKTKTLRQFVVPNLEPLKLKLREEAARPRSWPLLPAPGSLPRTRTGRSRLSVHATDLITVKLLHVDRRCGSELADTQAG